MGKVVGENPATFLLMDDQKKWLEVSLVVDGELAEAVSEVLARFTSGGVVIESTAILADDEDECRPVGPLRVCGYLPADDSLERTQQALREALWHLGFIRPLPEAGYRWVQETDWSEAWKEHYHPLEVGQRLLILPAWLEIETVDRTPIRMDPGMAFGTGTHPTTQLCLELLDGCLQEALPEGAAPAGHSSGMTVIDVGCGSGILAVAALLLGASHALAVDTDPEAVRASQANAALNGVADRIEIGQGSVDEILSGSYSLRRSPLVLANILAPVLVRLLGEGLGDLVTPGGQLILSGILGDQAGQVLSAAEAHGLHLVERRQSGDWVALLFSR